MISDFTCDISNYRQNTSRNTFTTLNTQLIPRGCHTLLRTLYTQVYTYYMTNVHNDKLFIIFILARIYISYEYIGFFT